MILAYVYECQIFPIRFWRRMALQTDVYAAQLLMKKQQENTETSI